jgi:hypothetical protein
MMNFLFNSFTGPHYPNFFVGSFTGTFILAYIVLWIVLPEAISPFQKMEMRGEKVDVNRIKENVQSGMSDFKTRMQAWGEEVKGVAQNMTDRAKSFSDQQARPFASDFGTSVVKPAASGIGHAIGVIFKAFFLFVAGSIALALFGVLIAFIFGGIAFWPINNFLWTSGYQKALAWGTLLFFVAVPVIGFITWLIRRIVKAKSNRYVGWTFSGLWTMGWICAVLLAASLAKDLRRRDSVDTDIPTNVTGNRLLVKVSEPPIRYTGSMWGVDNDSDGWDVTEDSMRYNNVKVNVDKSDDDRYHVIVYRFSQGSSSADAQRRAEKTMFTAFAQDSVLNIGSGLSFGRDSKFRGQSVIVEIKVPVGKMIRFDESIDDVYDPWAVRTVERRERRNGRRYRVEWDWEDDFSWQPNVDYIMTSDGKLTTSDKIINEKSGVFERKTNTDSLRMEIEKGERQLEKDRERLRDLERRRRDSMNTSTT